MSLNNVYLTVPVGESVRDYLILGTVRYLLDLLQGFRVVLLTPAYNVPEFLDLCPKDERLLIRRMEFPIANRNNRLMNWRLRLRNREVIRLFLKWESRRLQIPDYLAPTFQEFPPSLVVSTHPKMSCDYEVVMWARRLNVQTLGVVKSWDNVGKGLYSQPHIISVWNPVNKEEAIQLLGYRADEVEINGSPSFDAHYDPAFKRPRCEFFASLGLDPGRPVITLATGGVMNRGYYGRDETHLIEDTLRMIRKSEALRGAQLVLRLHCASHLEFFWKYWNRTDIRLSFSSYMPGIDWCPSREDLVEQVNLLNYSNVIVTPASSWTLEAAIFDTPTVVPVYSNLQPDHAAAQFDGWTLKRHFKPLVDNKWVPITRSYEETQMAMEEALLRPEKYANGRKSIVDTYIYYRGAGSCQRVAEWIAGIAKINRPGNPRGF